LIIETASVELDDAYAGEHKGVVPGPYVRLTISDTGCGMDADTRRQVFEPFFTTKEKDEGTGLGLATVYGIVKQHRGNIWVYSEPGKGTTFKVYLPVSSDAALAEEGPADSSSGTDFRGTETILLVEDNLQVRNLAAEILKRQGYTVLKAESGTEGLSVLARHPGPVHVLLTDVIMPDMNGKELFEQISRSNPDIKVLYMSGYTDNVIAHHGALAPGAHFLQKPFSVKTLCAKVREVLG
jgi:CheY-like chemotaxis protein